MTLRNYLFAGLLLTTCRPDGSVTREDLTAERIQIVCPKNQPEELTAHVLQKYYGNAPRLRAAAYQMDRTQAYHIYQALRDKRAARNILKEIFDTHTVACPGFEPSSAELNSAATEMVGGGYSPHLEEAFELFKKTGNKEGQRSVAQRYEQRASEGDSEYSRLYNFEQAINLYRKMGDSANAQRVITQIFTQAASVERAIREMKRLRVETTPVMLSARGDYWLKINDPHDLEALDKAFQAYQQAHDITGARKVLHAIEQKQGVERYIQLDVATQVALFVGDTKAAQEYARENFIQARFGITKEKELLARTGVKITHSLHQQRAEYQLREENFRGAYNTFQEAGDRTGLERVLDAMSTP